MYTTGQLNTVNNCTQLDNWIQSTTVHNLTTEYSQQLYTTWQRNTVKTVHNWTTEYGQNNWIQSIIVDSLKTEHSWLVAPRSLFWTSTISTNYCKCVANFLLNRLFKQTLAFLPWYTAWFPEQGGAGSQIDLIRNLALEWTGF